MNHTPPSFFDSLWFSATMCLISLIALTDNAIRSYADGQDILGLVIWLVIAFHFTKATYVGWISERLKTNQLNR